MSTPDGAWRGEPEHFTDGSPCWCSPRTVPVSDDPDDGAVIVHRTFADLMAGTTHNSEATP